MICPAGKAAGTVDWWLTTLDKTALLAEQAPLASLPAGMAAPIPAIVVDPSRQRQAVDGFGFALTGGSAQHIVAMSKMARQELLRELFSFQGNGIGISYLRISIGSSDLNARVFSYDDLPPGQTDISLDHFDMSDDRKDVIPVLKEILKINPAIKIMGSPWSAPVWMKTNNSIQGGKLREEYYPVYARYLVRYVKAMAEQGIPVDAVTVQNEPFNDGNTPSMQMFAKEEADFIKNHLGPAFRASGVTTKIILYDHNCDAPEYPVSILTDPVARPYVDGSGFHLYAGPITALSEVHDRFPDKNLYFTEMMAVNRREFDVAAPVARIVVGAMRNWSRNVILWNLAANRRFEPHTDNGGCRFCQGAITIDGDNVERNLAYYVIGHESKFVPTGSVRIDSTPSDVLPNVAFRTPDGRTVLVVANTARSSASFGIAAPGHAVEAQLPGGAVATFIW